MITWLHHDGHDSFKLKTDLNKFIWRSVYWQNYYVSWLRGNVIFFFFKLITTRLQRLPADGVTKVREKLWEMRSFFPFLSNVHSNVTSMSILDCGIEFHPVSPLRSNATPLFVVAGLNPPKKIHLRFDDFPSKSQGNWRVVHLSAAERRSGRFYQKGNIFSFCSRPSILVVLFLVLWENIYQYNSSARRVSICSWGGGGGGPRFQLRATDVAVSWLRFFILDFTW